VVHGTPIVTLNYDAGETIGWPTFVAEIAAAYRSLPPPSARINPRMDRARREVNPWSDASRMRVHIIYATGEGLSVRGRQALFGGDHLCMSGPAP
jgi:hypothetical protein